jgi:hypothetical protein
VLKPTRSIVGVGARLEHTHHHQVDHVTAAVEALGYFKSLDVPREKLIETFGHSGLPRYEAKLAAEDEAAARKAGSQPSMIDVTPTGAVAPMRSGILETS